MISIICMIKKTITIREDHEEWIKRRHINLSRFVQAKIDEEIKSEENQHLQT